MLTWFRDMNVDKKWTFLDHLPTSSCQRSLWSTPFGKFSNSFAEKQWDSVHEVMRFPLKEEEFAKIAEIDLQYPGNWFRLFSLNFIFYGNHVIFLFPFWPLIKVYFLFSCKCFVMSFFEESWWWWAYLFVTLFMVFSLPWELGNEKNIRTPGIILLNQL